tara:strand:+ start:111 stop:806 length:696 start_codon:yes stop_codon:yes gene_type:complete
MEIKDKILKALGLSEEVQLGYQAKLEDGTIITSSSDELAAGVDISILMEDGTSVPLPVGEYKTDDGVGFSVTEEGIVAEIYEEETEEETEEVEAKKDEEEYEEEVPAEEVVEEAVAVIESAVDVVAEAINEATPEEVTPEIAQVAAEAAVAAITPVVEEEVTLDSQIAELTAILKGELESVKAKLSKIEKKSGGEPVTANKFSKTESKKKVSYKNLSSKERFFHNLENIQN